MWRDLRRIGARTRLALTGTPIENGLGDLWAILDFANPGLVGARSAFGIAAERRTPRLGRVGRAAVDFLAHGRSASGDDSQRFGKRFGHRPRLS